MCDADTAIEKVEKAARVVNAHDVIAKLPDKYDTQVCMRVCVCVRVCNVCDGCMRMMPLRNCLTSMTHRCACVARVVCVCDVCVGVCVMCVCVMCVCDVCVCVMCVCV